MNVTGEVWIGDSSNGTLTMTGGTLGLNESWFEVGRGIAGGPATFNFLGGTVVKPSSNIAAVVVGWCPASSGMPIINMSGNALLDLPGGEFWIGEGSGNAGQMTMSNNATVNIANWFCVGRDFATGTLTINGGTINKSGLNFIVVGSLSGTGTVTQYAGTVNNPAILYLGEATGTGTYYLNGGLLQAAQVVSGTTTNPGAAVGNLYLNGGILQASAASTDFMTVNGTATLNVLIQSAGAKIDTNGFDVTINKILAFDPASTGGGLTKQGSGTLTITQNATYTGNTTASAGILDMLDINTPSATVTVEGGAELTARSVKCNTVTLGAGSTLIIKALPGGPTAALSISPVPEPGTLVLLAMAGLAMIFAKWRKKRP